MNRRYSRPHTTIAPRKRIRLFLALLLLILSSPLGLTVAHAQKAMRLTRIEVKGLKRYNETDIITTSGLKVGQVADKSALDAAADRLIKTGLFTKINYSYRSNNDQTTVVTFQVEEQKWSVPVVFDNFVWFTEQELFAAVRRDVPSFDGVAPEAGQVVDSITASLQRLLAERKINGKVDYMPSANLTGGDTKHVYSVSGVSLPVCAINFPGASTIKEGELVKNSETLRGTDYTRQFTLAYAHSNLIPLYRERGLLRAGFRDLSAKIVSNSDCPDGVAVTMPVEEGLVYQWNKAEWAGNNTYTVAELDAALAMKTGETANGLKIEAGVGALRDLYGKKGYLMVKLKAKQEFDDAERRVTYRFNIEEGPQFRMGALIVTGLNEGDSNDLKKKWKIKTGDVFDDSYLEEFVREHVRKKLVPGRSTMDTKISPDRQKLIVDVSINVKPE